MSCRRWSQASGANRLLMVGTMSRRWALSAATPAAIKAGLTMGWPKSAQVIPPAALPELQSGIEKLLATEKLILDPARMPGFDFKAFGAAWTAFEKART